MYLFIFNILKQRKYFLTKTLLTEFVLDKKEKLKKVFPTLTWLKNFRGLCMGWRPYLIPTRRTKRCHFVFFFLFSKSFANWALTSFFFFFNSFFFLVRTQRFQLQLHSWIPKGYLTRIKRKKRQKHKEKYKYDKESDIIRKKQWVCSAHMPINHWVLLNNTETWHAYNFIF